MVRLVRSARLEIHPLPTDPSAAKASPREDAFNRAHPLVTLGRALARGTNLVLTRRSLIVILALIALVVAQSAAGLHALAHVGPKGDAAGVPGQHAKLCLECASFAPLAGAHGGSGALPVVAFVATDGIVLAIEAASFSRRPNSSFQARAPPR